MVPCENQGFWMIMLACGENERQLSAIYSLL